MILEGSITLRLLKDDDSESYTAKLKKGDFAYIPRGTKYQFKTHIVKKDDELEGDRHTLYLKFTTASNNNWVNLI